MAEFDDHHRALVAGTCVHHRGSRCALGVPRITVQVSDWPTWPRDPCFQPPGRPAVPDTCDQRRLPTEEEIDARMEEYEELMRVAAEAIGD